MIRVLIAEDEELIREGLRCQLPWRSLGLQVVGLAANGLEAVRLCRELKPRILLTDIRMPLLGGLELIQQVRELDPRIVSIIISGYDDFSYAQQAIALGVSHYFLKPLELEQIEDKLREIAGRLRLEGRQSRQRAVRDRLLAAVLPFVRRQYFLELIYGPYESREVRESLSGLGPAPERSFCGVAVAQVQVQAGEKGQANDALERRLSRLLRNEHYQGEDVYLLKRTAAEALFVVVFIGEQEAPLRQRLERYVQGLRALPPVSAAVCGTVAPRLNDLHKSFGEARKELLLQQLLRRSGLPAGGGLAAPAARSADLLSALGQAIERGDGGQVALLLQRIEAEAAAPQASEGERTAILAALFRCLSPAAQQAGLNLETRFFQAERETAYDHGDACFGELLAGLREAALELVALHSSRRDQAARHLIEKAKHFIERRCAAWDLSLEEVADHVELNPSYFSVVFKNAEGVNYIDYLTGLRMRKARELLGDATLKIGAVARKVGFQSPGYFGYLFKKHYGCTPTAFRGPA